MPVAVQFTSVVGQGGELVASGLLTFTGSYATGGDVLDLTKATFSGAGLVNALPVALKNLPYNVDFANAQGFSFEWVQGTDITTGKVQCWASSASEHSAGAYEAGLLAEKNAFCQFSFKPNQ